MKAAVQPTGRWPARQALAPPIGRDSLYRLRSSAPSADSGSEFHGTYDSGFPDSDPKALSITVFRGKLESFMNQTSSHREAAP